MAVGTVTQAFQRGKRSIDIALAATVVPNSSTKMIEIPVEGVSRIFVQLAASVAALTNFTIKALPSGTSVLPETLFSTASDFLNPQGLLVGCSGDLTTLSGTTGWFIMDTIGLETVQLWATSGGTAILIVDGSGGS